jgi:hypothetical protein
LSIVPRIGSRRITSAIEEINADQLPLYDGIPTWFEVKSTFRVEVVEAGLGGMVASDAPVYPMDRFQRQDLAVLWDIRVHPEHREQGSGGVSGVTTLLTDAVDELSDAA